VASAKIANAIRAELEVMGLSDADIKIVDVTVFNLVSLHDQGWNGIWCSILADRFAAGAIPRSNYVCGNPPWVKWSNLPEEYTKTIQTQCRKLGVFSNAKWVGGIEADISTVITYQAIQSYLAPSGRLGFFLPGSIFTTPSSAGFRKFSVGPENIACKVLFVEDFDAIHPFDGVTNMPRFLALERDSATIFPVPYRIWTAGDTTASTLRRSNRSKYFRDTAKAIDYTAVPVPGGENGRPWLIGTNDEQAVFAKIFGGTKRAYQARKGVTADRNGIFWVYETEYRTEEISSIKNAATIGKTKGIPEITANIESKNLFPLLRGQGVKPFNATPDSDLRIVVPQRGMHGDPDLAINSPLTFKFLNKFKEQLQNRSSLKRFQKGQPFYSLWSTGEYTFAPFKVLWREIGKSFAAAYVGGSSICFGTEKIVIPDHKLYFIPVETEEEAAYLAGFLNAPMISNAVSAYASQLSLGVSVADYLNIPKFDAENQYMKIISELAIEISSRKGSASNEEFYRLDELVGELLKT
jgi:hypothetical protein